MNRILVLNGPNLGRLGTRLPEIYGSASLEDLANSLRRDSAEDVVEVRQTDSESEMLSWLYESVDTHTPVVLNAGAWTHYSLALHDAVELVTDAGGVVIEVHVSNPHSRESFRHTSVISAVVTGVIAGFGVESYQLAVDYIRRNVR